MNENILQRVHALTSKSQSAFQHAATAPLLTCSGQPHPALGTAGSIFPSQPQLASVMLSSLQMTVEALVSRVAKLESLFFVFESNQQHQHSATSPSAYHDMRSMLHETMEPMRQHIRRHESLLLDLVQAMNHTAAWGYGVQSQSQPLSRPAHTTGLPVPLGATTPPPQPRPNDGEHIPAGEQVVVSPLTKADASHVGGMSASTGPSPLRGGSLNDATAARIERMRSLAQRLGSAASAPEEPEQHRNRRAASHEIDDSDTESANLRQKTNRDRGQPARHAPEVSSHRATTSTSESGWTKTSSRTSATTTATSMPLRRRDDAHTTTSTSSGDHPRQPGAAADRANVLLKNVNRLLSKATTHYPDESGTSTTNEVVQRSLLLSADRSHQAHGSTGEDELLAAQALLSPPKLTFLETTSMETDESKSHGVRMASRYPDDSSINITAIPASVFMYQTTTDDADTTAGSSMAMMPGHYRRGMDELGPLSPPSPHTARFMGALNAHHHDTSSASDAYRELAHRFLT